MDERERIVEREPERVTHETTVIHTGERRGGGGVLVAIILLIAVVVGLFLLFGGGLNETADDVNIDVNLTAPDLPDIDLPAAPAESPAPPQPAN